MEWKEQYKHPKWQKKRLEILERDEYMCIRCCDNESTLHVHHKYYDSDKLMWDYPDSCYLTLCNECHWLEHEAIKIFNALDHFPETPGTIHEKLIGLYHTNDKFDCAFLLNVFCGLRRSKGRVELLKQAGVAIKKELKKFKKNRLENGKKS
jgi:hypothetical protein